MAQYTTLLPPQRTSAIMDGSEQIAEDKSSFDLQAQRPFEADTLNTEIVQYKPYTTDWETGNEIQVRIPCTDYHWIDLKSMKLFLRFRITKLNSDAFAGDAHAIKSTMTSNFIGMFFKNINIDIDNSKRLINNCDVGLATAMLRILNNKKKDTETLQQSEYYQPHRSGPNIPMPVADEIGDAPETVKWRWEIINGSPHIEIETDIFHYFTQQKKMLPPAVKFALVFLRNKPEKMFNWDATVNASHPIVTFDEFYVQLRRVRLDSEATVQRLDSITNKSSTIDYDITRYTTTRIIFSPMVYLSIPVLSSGTIARRIVIGFVRNEAVSDSGNSSFDSLYFENLDIENIFIKYDNKIYPKEGGYKINRRGNERQRKINLRRTYLEVMRTWKGSHEDSELTFDLWSQYYNLYTFDLTPNAKAYDSQNYDQMKMIGDLSLEVTFERAPQEQYSIIMLSEYNNTVSIDMQSMTPIFDFSS